MKRLLLNLDYLIERKPHLVGKYFWESSEYLTKDMVGDIVPDAPYRFERIRQMIARNLSEQQKDIALEALKDYGKKVQTRVSELLYVQE